MNRLVKFLSAVIIAAPAGFEPMPSQAETASPATEWNFDREQPGTLPGEFIKDCRVHIFYDGKQILNLCDKTSHDGMIGLWTKSDAVTYFDDLQLQHVN